MSKAQPIDVAVGDIIRRTLGSRVARVTAANALGGQHNEGRRWANEDPRRKFVEPGGGRRSDGQWVGSEWAMDSYSKREMEVPTVVRGEKRGGGGAFVEAA